MSTESGMVLVPRIPTDEIVDSVRYMLTGIELHSGRRTIGNFRTHCDHSGVDFSHWPTWATDGKHDDEHLTKSGLGELLYATFVHAAAPASPPTPAVDENADRQTLMFWMIEAHHERMPGPHPRWLKNRNTQETTQNVADAIKWQNAFSAAVERQQLRGIGGDVSHNFIVTEHSHLEPPK